MSTAVSENTSSTRVSGWAKNLAIVSGLLAFLCFALTPLLPVNQTQSSFSWPQNDSLNSVNAPLISLAPEKFEASVPVSALGMLNDGETMLLGTLPADSPQATDRGLFVRGAEDEGLDVIALSEVIFNVTAEELADLEEDAVLEIALSGDGTEISIPGTDLAESTEEDYRPQLTGVYTEIADTADNQRDLAAAGLSADVEINSRFTSTPTTLKLITMWAGTVLMLISLFALRRMDRGDGKRIPFLNARWRSFRPLDALVGAVLVFWYVFGANTSDDGFTTTMARVSEHAGYMANYYRWYGVPESPFGSPYYDLLALLSSVSAASIWMRLPSLVSGLLIWWILSREIIPRFGPAVAGRRVAYWTAAMIFLAFWLPYNNGTRPEPLVALGAVAAWALFERAIELRRLFPAALGTIIAAITLTVGPTGLLAVGAFLVALPYLFRILGERLSLYEGPRWQASASMLAPFLAGGTFVMVPVFADQTLMAVLESTRVRGLVGPALDWYSEYVRYATLFQQTVDGSLTRRFAVFAMLISIILIVFALIRWREVPGVAKGPTVRLMIIIGLSFFFLMFTPTKWTHHFGIYAGMAGALGALAAVVLSRIALQSPRARTFTWAGTIFMLALTFAGWNAWWYVSSFGVPWWDKTPQFKGVEFSTIMLVIAMVVLVVGLWQSMRHDRAKRSAREAGTLAQFREGSVLSTTRWNGLAAAPLAIAAALVVLSAVLSFTKSTIDQYPAYSVGLGNLRSLAGNTCSLANEAMIETNTNDSFLTPVDPDMELGESLEAGEVRGFDPQGIPDYIAPRTQIDGTTGAMGGTGEDAGTVADATAGEAGSTTGEEAAATDASDASDAETDSEEQETADTSTQESTGTATSADVSGGVRSDSESGVNGSTSELPFDLDYTKIPVLGSWTSDSQFAAEVETAWFRLPEAAEEAPLLVVSAAGRIAHHDQNGVAQPGEKLLLEYGRTEGTDVEKLGETEMMDIGPDPTWRNLRLPLENLPAEADAVRIVAEDNSLDPQDWIAFTPPRAPELAPLGTTVSMATPALLDWSVALQFPCQRSFDHWAGVTEIPEYRISPDHPGKAALTGFMDFLGGGSMATVQAVNTAAEIPSYTRDDWHRDWGSVQSYELRTNSQGVAPDLARIDEENIVRSGLWHESDMKIREIEG